VGFLSSVLFNYRTSLYEFVLEKNFFNKDGKGTLLKETVKPNLLQLICAADLQSARNFYFSGKFVYSYFYGHSDPGNIRLSQAV